MRRFLVLGLALGAFVGCDGDAQVPTTRKTPAPGKRELRPTALLASLDSKVDASGGCGRDRAKPRTIESRLEEANGLVRQARYDEAVLAYKELVELDPTRAAAHYGLWLAYGRTGNEAGAAKEMAILRNLLGSEVASHDEMAPVSGPKGEHGSVATKLGATSMLLCDDAPIFEDEVKREVRVFARVNAAASSGPAVAVVGTGSGALLSTRAAPRDVALALVQAGMAAREGTRAGSALVITLTWKGEAGERRLEDLVRLRGGAPGPAVWELVTPSGDGAAFPQILASTGGVVAPALDQAQGPVEVRPGALPPDGTAVMLVIRARR